MNSQQRYERLLARRAPNEDRQLYRFAEAFEREQGENTKFLLGAMKAVETKYTERLKEQGDRVENQLAKGLSTDYPQLDFRRQGSVSNLTHIRYSSDVDVLVLIDRFFTLEHPQQPAVPYLGNPESDLLTLRKRCCTHLSTVFYAVNCDDSGSTAIRLSGGSLVCAVDVVPSNWLNTNTYAISNNERDRAVQVLNRPEMERKTNRPFLFNYKLNEHDLANGGRTRAYIRLLKTIKFDLEEETAKESPISSFDLASIVYRMPNTSLNTSVDRPLELISSLITWLKVLLSNEEIRSWLKVVDESRTIFDSVAKIQGLQSVYDSLRTTYLAAIAEQAGKPQYVTAAHLVTETNVGNR